MLSTSSEVNEEHTAEGVAKTSEDAPPSEDSLAVETQVKEVVFNGVDEPSKCCCKSDCLKTLSLVSQNIYTSLI